MLKNVEALTSLQWLSAGSPTAGCCCRDEKGHLVFTSVCVNTVRSTLDTAERPPGLAQQTGSPPAEEELLLIDKYSIQSDGAICKAQAGCFCSCTPQSLALDHLVWCKHRWEAGVNADGWPRDQSQLCEVINGECGLLLVTDRESGNSRIRGRSRNEKC